MLEVRTRKKPVACVTVEGNGTWDVPGILGKISQAIAKKGICVYAISNGDNDIEFFVGEEKADAARSAIAQEAPKLKSIRDITILRGIGVVSVRGERFHNSPTALARIMKIANAAGAPPVAFVMGIDGVKLFFEAKKCKAAFVALEKNISSFADIA